VSNLVSNVSKRYAHLAAHQGDTITESCGGHQTWLPLAEGLCRDASIEFAVVTWVEHLAPLLERSGVMGGRSPYSVAAAMVLHVAMGRSLDVPAKLVADTAGIAVTTLRKNHKLVASVLPATFLGLPGNPGKAPVQHSNPQGHIMLASHTLDRSMKVSVGSGGGKRSASALESAPKRVKSAPTETQSSAPTETMSDFQLFEWLAATPNEPQPAAVPDDCSYAATVARQTAARLARQAGARGVSIKEEVPETRRLSCTLNFGESWKLG